MSEPRSARSRLGPRSPLTRVELTARRASVRRRRVRRRRTVAGIAVLLIAIAIAVGAMAGSGSGSSHADAASPPAASATNGASPGTRTAPAARRKRKSAPSHHPRVLAGGAAGAAGAASTSAAERARAVDHVLGYTSYVQLAGHRRREVALTFDDGPSPYTDRVLDVLKRMHVPATFFVVGRSVTAFPKQLAAEIAAGEEVGDHTQSHPLLGALSAAAQSAEIGGLAHLIERHHAPYPVVMRPPYGSFDASTLQILHDQRMLMVLWSVDTKDYSRPGVDRIVYTAVSGAAPGAIILMHDGGGERSQTVAALPRIIRRLRQRGFRLVSVARLVKDDPPPRHQPSPRPLSGGI